VVFPRPGVAVAAGPGVEAEAVAHVPRESALVTVAGEQRARAPGVDSPTLLVIFDELAFVAITPWPGLDASALLHALMELPGIRRAPFGRTVPLRLPSGTPTLVGAL